jgi:hypothetical protein
MQPYGYMTRPGAKLVSCLRYLGLSKPDAPGEDSEIARIGAFRVANDSTVANVFGTG